MEFRELSVISRNSDQISWKLQAKITDLLRFQQKAPKMRKFHENFTKFCENLQNSRNPACESCRARKIWKNEYLVAIVAVDTAENGPPKVLAKLNKLFSRLPRYFAYCTTSLVSVPCEAVHRCPVWACTVARRSRLTEQDTQRELR